MKWWWEWRYKCIVEMKSRAAVDEMGEMEMARDGEGVTEMVMEMADDGDGKMKRFSNSRSCLLREDTIITP